MTEIPESLRYIDEGEGRPILILPGGMNDPSDWAKVAERLVPRFRAVRLHRRQYRLDLHFDRAVTMADEVEDVLAMTDRIGRPVLVVGHSSGAVLALEAMVSAPERFAGAVLYEPPLVVGPPLGGAALLAAREAVDTGAHGKALGIFLRDVVGFPWWVSPLARAAVPFVPRFRGLIARQLDDAEAIDAMGVRLDAYARIEVPTVFLRGDRSPAHLADRTAAAAEAMPGARRVAVLHGQGHGGNQGAPNDVARVIADAAESVL